MKRQLNQSQAERFDYAQGIASGGCSDIDMYWERGGHFLFIENKRPGESFSTGQLIGLRALDKQPNCTVWVVRGNPPDDIHSAGPLDGEQFPLDVDSLRKRIQRWWDEHAAWRKAA